MAERQLVKAFRIKACVGWMPNVMGEGPSAACVITCECGHNLSVNDAWGRVYEPKPGGWLVVNQEGRAAYRSEESFARDSVHVEKNYYYLPMMGDISVRDT